MSVTRTKAGSFKISIVSILLLDVYTLSYYINVYDICLMIDTII